MSYSREPLYMPTEAVARLPNCDEITSGEITLSRSYSQHVHVVNLDVTSLPWGERSEYCLLIGHKCHTEVSQCGEWETKCYLFI